MNAAMQSVAVARAGWHRAVAAWKAIPREDFAATFVFAAAHTAYDAFLVAHLLDDVRGWIVLLAFRFLFYEIGALALLAGIATADSLKGARARLGALALTLIGSGLLVATLLGWLFSAMGEFEAEAVLVLVLGFVVARGVRNAGVRTGIAIVALALAVVAFQLGWQELTDDPERLKDARTFYSYARHHFWNWELLAGAAMFIFLDRRRTRAARARRHAAEMDRARSAKRALESRLQAMQARVEPQFLFNTLAQVGDLYRTDPARGEHMLDELIAYLRAAMPKMRDTSSTLGQELELVRAYLGIVSLRLGGRLVFEIGLPNAHLAEARVPPMMLLPLVDHAVTHGFTEPNANGSIRIHTVIANGRARLEVNDSGVGFLAEGEGDGITGIRERLLALYGDDARLDLDRADQPGTRAVMEIPYEVMEAGSS